MPVIGNYVPGQILYAANLNLSFSQSAAIAGDAFTGNVTAPNLSITGTEYVNVLAANTKITIQGVDISTGLQNAYNTANAAFAAANTANSNLNNILIQSISNTANTALATAIAALPQTGGVVTGGGLTINSTLNVSNTITGNTEIHGTANAVIYPAQFRAMYGNFGAIIRNDGTNFYLLTTGSVVPGLTGVANFNSLRPFTFNLTTGQVTIDATGVGTTFGGNVTSTNINAQTANVVSLRSNTITASYTLTPQDSGVTLFYNSSNPGIITVNNNLPANFRVIVTQIGSGQLTFQSGVGVVIHPRTGTLFQITNQYASASLVSYVQNSFVLDGSIQ